MQKKKRTTKSFFSLFNSKIKSSRRKSNISLRKATLISGLIFIGIGFALRLSTPSSLSFSGEFKPIESVSRMYVAPARVEIPSIKVNLPVEESSIFNGKWEVSDKNVSHLDSSNRPGENGNIILYGHNSSSVLKSLHKLEMGDVITLFNTQGEKYIYKVYSIITVNPDDMKALTDFKNQTLTIYTCTGFADTKRLLVKAERNLYSYSSILQ